MKVKYNNLFLITPIFFTIALVMSFLDYKDEMKVLDWSIESKAKAIAIPSRIFIEHMLKEKSLTDISPKLEKKFVKIIQHKQATRIYISKKSRILIDTNKEKISKLVTIRNLKKSRITDFFIQGDLKLVTIHIPIKSKEKNLVLSVDVDCSTFYNDKKTSLIKMILTIIFAIFFGVITSVILSRIITLKIYELNADAAAIAAGNYSPNSYVENIREFTDLGDTLNIMKSIMNEIISKTKNAMLKEEKLQNNDDIVDVFHNISHSNEIVSIKNINLYITLTGIQKAEYFYKSFVHDNKIFAYTGKVATETSTIITLLNATATQKYITAHIENASFDVMKMLNIFQVDYFELICIDETGIMQSTKIIEGQKIEKEVILENEIVNFKCMNNSSIKNKLEIYIANFQELSLTTLIKDLPSILENKKFELFILFEKRKLS